MKKLALIVVSILLFAIVADASNIAAITYNRYVAVIGGNVFDDTGTLYMIPGVRQVVKTGQYVVAYGGNSLHLFRANDLALLWSRYVPEITSVSLTASRVYVGTMRAYLVYDLNGSLLVNRYVGVPVVVGGPGYAAYCYNNSVRVVAADRGDVVLEAVVPGNVSLEPIAVGEVGGAVWAVVRDTAGGRGWIVSENGIYGFFGDPVDADACWGMVCVVAGDAVTAYNVSGPAPVWAVGVPAGAVDAAAGNHLYWVATENGLVGISREGSIVYYEPGNYTGVATYMDYVFALDSEGRVYWNYAPGPQNLYVVRVVDKYGNPVPGANVTIAKYSAVTDENGVARIRVPANEDPGVIYAQLGRYVGEKHVTRHYYVETTVVLSELVYGHLVVEVEPAEAAASAEVVVAGADVYKTAKPGEDILLPVGNYTVTVTAPGFTEKKINVTVERGVNKIKVKLSVKKYQVIITVYKRNIPLIGGFAPAAAEVTVDDIQIGRIVRTALMLTPGSHTIVATDRFYISRTEIVRVDRDGVQVDLYLDYDPAVQAAFAGALVFVAVLVVYALKTLVARLLAWIRERRELVLE